MTNVDYCLLNPNGNKTVLVLSHVPDSERAEATARLLKTETEAEQLGYVCIDEADAYSLEMSGGEFCGNASLSLAALIAQNRNIIKGEELNVSLRVSGAGDSIPVRISRTGEASFTGTVTMPAVKNIVRASLTPPYNDVMIVSLPGITHIIASTIRDKDAAESVLRAYARENEDKAVGIVHYDESSGSIEPLVYVPSSDTMYWEGSCASGTAALGAALAYREGKAVSIKVSQPAGELYVEAEAGERARISGSVEIVAFKTVCMGEKL